jgi:hypothetical protein
MKLAKDMTELERKNELEKIKRGSPPEPMPITDQPKTAKQMTPAERQEFLREHKKRFP